MPRSRGLCLELLEDRRLLALSPVGAEFPVGGSTLGAQSTFSQCPAPAVAVDVAGNFAVVWASDGQDGSDYGVYGHRFSSTGSPLWDEFQVNTTTNSAQKFPSIAMDRGGNFVVTWSSYLQDGSGYGVYAQRFDAAGEPQGDEFQVNTFTSGNQNFSAVAADADGNFVITWTSQDQDGSGTGIFAQRYQAGGTAIGDEFRVNTTTGGNQRYSSVAADAAGNFVVTWTGQDGSGSGIFARRYRADGTATGDEFQINTTTTSTQQLSSISVNSGGNHVAVWQGYDPQDATWKVYAQRFDPAGAALGDEMEIGQGRFPSTAMASTADFVVAWQTYDPHSGEPTEIRVQHYDPFGVAEGQRVQMSNGLGADLRSPSIAMGGDHLALFVTSESPSGDDSIAQAQLFGVTLPSGSNRPPMVAAIDDQMVGEGEALSLTATATDTNVPADGLTFSLDPGAPDGAQINAQTGEFTWTPSEEQGPGTYNVTVRATDDGTPPLSGLAAFLVTVAEVNQATIEDRHVFYNCSAFDGDDPAAGPEDDAAIAPDKQALLPGGVATFDNYTSYSRGINGIMVDIAGLPDGVTPRADDFRFRVGNSNDPSTWLPAPQPTTVTLREDAATGGSDRVTVIWADNVIRNQWLQVTVLAAGLGLAEDDVFYFGNAVAEAGNSASDAQVTTSDLLLARNNPRVFLSPDEITFDYDYNRDRRVNTTDVLLARNNQTNLLTALRLIDLSSAEGERSMMLGSAEGESSPAAPTTDAVFGNMAWLYEFEQLRTPSGPSQKSNPTEDAVDKLLATYWP